MAQELQSFALGHYEHRQTAQGMQPVRVSEYIYLPTPQGPMPVAAEIGGRLYAIHTDHLNTPRQLTDESGQPVWQWAVSAFGEVEATTAETGWIRPRNGSAGPRNNTQPVTFNLRFPGQQFDEETGLHYNHHRYYDPYLTVGYTEADPLGLQAGWNRFVYAENDPLGYSDAEGLQAAAIPAPLIGLCAGSAGAGCAATAAGAVGLVSYELTDRYVNPWLQPKLTEFFEWCLDSYVTLMAKGGKENHDNEYSREAMNHPDPCEWLRQQYQMAKGDGKRKKKIIEAQKALGCRWSSQKK